MRGCVALMIASIAGLALVVPSNAQYTTTAVTSTQVAGGGSSASGQSAGFFGGITPTNIVNKPIDVGGAVKPLNVQSAVMPQQQSPKVFDIGSAFSKVQMPLFRSTAPATPVIPAGKSNPIQPTGAPKIQAPPPQRKLLGFIPY